MCNFAHGEDELRQLPPRNLGGASGGGGGGGRGAGRGFGLEHSYGAGYNSAPHDLDQAAFHRADSGQHQSGQSPGLPRPFQDTRPQDSGRPSNNDLWAAQGYPVPGPNGWTQYSTPDTGEPYYHNHVSGETVWDKPPEWR